MYLPMRSLLPSTTRIAITAHMLRCLLLLLWEQVGGHFQQQPPAVRRLMHTVLEEWVEKHAPGIDLAELLGSHASGGAW
jgi:hypothetical protein